jgi:predicted metal-dependent hydrolase
MTDLLQSMPPIQRRVKANARRLKLRIEHHQIYLTIPPHSSEQSIQAFLRQSYDWLNTTWARAYASTAHTQTPQQGEILHLPLLNQHWQIQLESALSTLIAKPLLKPAVHDSVGQNLLVNHSIICVNAEQAAMQLKGWVREQAAQYLPKRLAQLAQYGGFSYRRCQVRHAKTRWGSCSSQALISLNAGLILLPVPVLDYVLWHELCHTRQLNHSAKFWQEVAQFDADYLNHRQQLKAIKLPAWWYQA